ncbi:MAG: glycosyltransferase [Lachnospiraceae bacterium]|nr:glycosyltransferase [Lachnospiraceae bacterium]
MVLTDRKRVFFINVTCGYGSTGRIVTGIYETLEEMDCVCMAAYGRGNAPRGYNTYRIGDDTGVYIHGIASRITDRQGFYSTHATRELIRRIEKFDPDVIHLHNIHGYYLNVKVLFEYLKKCGRKIIWTLHDCWSFTGHCTHFEYIGCMKWQNGCGNCEQLREYPGSWIADSSAKNLRQKRELFSNVPDMVLVTPSKWLKSKVQSSFMSQYPVTVIPTGIDLDVFTPSPSDLRSRYGIGDDKYLILGVANPWRDRKGLDEFKRLSRILPDKYRIVMVGLKPRQAAALPPEIISLPRTDSVKEMARWYSAADVYVNLTLEDTFPTTNIEALACGTPVVTYKSGGSPESITDKCGIAVSRSNISAVAAAIDVIVSKGDLTDACVRRASIYGSYERFGQYYDEVYEKILL